MTRQQAVEAIIEKRRKMVNSAIEEDLPIDEPRRLYEASRYLLEAGGKRLRPTITLLAAEALADVAVGSEEFRAFPAADRSPVDIMAAAVSIEIIQSFTLIHDDIMDDDDMRRGVPAVHREYDLSTAILAGDTLYSKAFENMLDTGAPAERSVRALSELATTCTEICEGQSLDIQFEQRPAITPDEYLGMVELKTAVLYAAAASIPAVLLGHDEAVEPLHSYGLDIGRAFQIQDDLLDLTTPTEKLGKQRGSDLVEGKQTIITVHARDQGVDIESLVDTNSVEAVTEAEIDDAVAELERAGSIEYARSTARELVDSGKSHLDVLPENESHELLNNIADYLIEREY
ncbi:geranylfarnesyl diphosphate synthase [Halobacteriaceae archaeon SHR40]|uniref:geranylfarnesyl diphosphate synthase n=1 Tax=Halovenus amylolytica TaxID=2500550 RepID=UPI000FE2CD8A